MASDSMIPVSVQVGENYFDVNCDPTLPSSWLINQVQRIYLTKVKSNKIDIENFTILYNQTKRQVINSDERISATISQNDCVALIDSERVGTSAKYNMNSPSSVIPWLDGPFKNSQSTFCNSPSRGANQLDCESSSDVLFFQQLHAFELIGQRMGSTTEGRKKVQLNEANLLSLLREYYVLPGYKNVPTPEYPDVEGHTVEDRSFRNDCPSESLLKGKNHHEKTPEEGKIVHKENKVVDISVKRSKNSPDSTPSNVRTVKQLNPSNFSWDSIFDIVFTQKAIGMKLGADETKKFVYVKESFANSEAKKYPEIVNGVVILAVNGHDTVGIGLSRTLYRLRDAKRPVLVRFGKLSTSSQFNTWG